MTLGLVCFRLRANLVFLLHLLNYWFNSANNFAYHAFLHEITVIVMCNIILHVGDYSLIIHLENDD